MKTTHSQPAVPQPRNRRLAVLIDADNVSYRLVEPLLAEIHQHGRSTIKRVYGDWSAPRLAPWMPLLSRHGILAVQQSQQVSCKNSSDVSLVIDAMDLLHSRRVDGFCIVSSDSDFTRLAVRIREEGLWVLCCGSKTASPVLFPVCDVHLCIEDLQGPTQPLPAPALVPLPPPLQSASLDLEVDHLKLADLLLKAYESSVTGSNHRVTLSALGSALHLLQKDFDPRKYGHSQLTRLIRASGLFHLHMKKNPAGKDTVEFVTCRVARQVAAPPPAVSSDFSRPPL